METINYDSEIAGLKTLWIIRFEGTYPHFYGQEKEKPHFDILYPSPMNEGRWLVVNVDKNSKDLDTVQKYQKICEAAKRHSQDKTILIDGLSKKVANDDQDIKDLAQLLVYFSEIMRQIKREDEE